MDKRNFILLSIDNFMDKFVYKNLSINKVIHNLDKKLVEKRSYSQFDKKIKELYDVLRKKRKEC